jgi:hypothetical protein
MEPSEKMGSLIEIPFLRARATRSCSIIDRKMVAAYAIVGDRLKRAPLAPRSLAGGKAAPLS